MEKSLIRGLTIRQPWTIPICKGDKQIENRRWLPPPNMINQYIAIHRGASVDDEAFTFLARRGYDVSKVLASPEPSGVVAVARLVGAISTIDQCRDIDKSWYARGQYGWQLADIVPIPLIECRGAQKLWVLPEDVLESVRVAWAYAVSAHTRGVTSY
jgi:hypothetical protein